jgi:hypothetical protein
VLELLTSALPIGLPRTVAVAGWGFVFVHVICSKFPWERFVWLAAAASALVEFAMSFGGEGDKVYRMNC